MRISQFQKYSQKENTVTNNVLLMLSRLNDLNNNYYKSIIEFLNEGSQQEYHSQPIFSQQVKAKNGIIDGHIEVKPSKIIIETKLNSTEVIGKLVKYGKSFKEGYQNQLWHLSSVKFTVDEEKQIDKQLKELYPELSIQFNNLLFIDLIDNLNGISEENPHDSQLKLLLKDFIDYCYESNLVSNEEYKLLFVPTGLTFDWNLKHKMYYCPQSWHSQNFKFFGFYRWKSIRTISEVETVVLADFNHLTGDMKVYSKGHTENQLNRLETAFVDLGESHEKLKYYIFPEQNFFETDFRKESHGGIQGYRYKDLRDYIDIEDYEDVKLISEKLRNVTWR